MIRRQYVRQSGFQLPSLPARQPRFPLLPPARSSGAVPLLPSALQPVAETASRSSLLSMDNIQRWVGQTQQLIQTAQQAMPMIQQYGPLIKNLPAMWKLYRSVKALPDAEVSETPEAPGAGIPAVDLSAPSTPSAPVLRDSRPRLYV